MALAGSTSLAIGAEVTPPASGVTASTSDTNVAGNTVDNNLGTRWSGSGDGAWIRFDLGSSQLVESVSVAAYQGNARRNQFDLQVSADGTSWTTVLAGAQTSGTSTNEQSFDIADTAARYVRYVGHGATLNAGGTSTWNSVTEVSIFAAAGGPTPTPTTPPAATPTPTPTTPGATPTPTATPTTVPGDSEITPGASGVSASTNDGNLPGNTVDNNLATRWSANGDGHSITFNLGASHTVTRVRIAFYSGNVRQSRFDLQVSSNGTTWTNVLTNQLSSGTSLAEQEFNITDSTAQYVRYLGHGNTVNMWNSLTEVSIFGTACTSCPTPVPTNTPTATPVQPTATPTPTLPPGGTRPVDINGQLSVCGTKLCNQHGNPIQLRGMSTHGLQWYRQCYDPGSAWIDALANDWKADVLRVSMYVQEGGYETNPTEFTALADRIIDKAIARGLYVVIDWHMLTPGDPMFNLTRARTYFTHMAQRYGNTPNVLYEIANEPNGSAATWNRIREYSNAIIPTIRNIDPNGVVLIGTPHWSSLGMSGSGGGPSEVINNPVAFANVMYVFHMYTASHGSTYLNALSNAANSIPMFVTEWGTQEASGDGPNNFTMAQQYVDMMRTKQISWINWNYSDDSRSGAVFTGGTCPNGPFTGAGGRLKAAGTWIRDRIINPPDNFPTN
jgi:aryl-phospho-beta-D-glucosidase BglC (GH1 family)